MDIVQAIYSNPVAAWVRESNALLAFTGLLFLHAVGLAFAAGVSAVIDLRLLGVVALPVGSLATLFRIVWTGFGMSAFSGVLLLMGNAIHDFANPLFYMKMVLVALAAVSVRLVQKRVFAQEHVGTPVIGAAGYPAQTMVADVAPTDAKLLAGVSLALWTLTIVTGRLSEYPSLFGIAN